MKQKSQMILKWLGTFWIVTGGAVFATQQAPIVLYTSSAWFGITFFMAIIILGGIVIKKYEDIINLLHKHSMFVGLFAFLLAYITAEYGYTKKGSLYLDNTLFGIEYNCHAGYLYTIPYLSIVFWICIVLCSQFFHIIMTENKLFDAKSVAIFLFFGYSLIILFYSIFPVFYYRTDAFFGNDSGVLFKLLWPDPNYFDIRHPLTGIFTFPIFGVAEKMAIAFGDAAYSEFFAAIIIQSLNFTALVMIGIMLSEMTNKKLVGIFWIISFPTLFYMFCLEKYQFCAFFPVAYLYLKRKKMNYYVLLIVAIGVLPTNVYLLIVEFFSENNLKKIAQNFLSVCLYGVSILVLSGRTFLLNPFGLRELVLESHRMYADAEYGNSVTWTLANKIIATVNMIGNAIIAIPVINREYYPGWKPVTWMFVYEKSSFLLMIVFAVVIIGLVANIKEWFSNVLALSIASAVVLFMFFNWDIYESPLFTIIYSWAIVPAFVFGIEKIGEWVKLKRQLIIGGILLAAAINLAMIIKVFIFSLTIY